MLIKVGDFEFTEVWDRVLYKKLSNYPQITDWEIRNIIDFRDSCQTCKREVCKLCELCYGAGWIAGLCGCVE